MQFLHVTDSVKDLDIVNKFIKDGKHVFLFIHSELCGHCVKAIPFWKKLKHRLSHKNRPDVLVADINQKVLSDVNKITNVGTISGYPTIKYIHGKKVKEFNQERTTDLFMNWIETNIGNAVSMNNKTRKGQRGGGWFTDKVIENGDDTAIMTLRTYLENLVKDTNYKYKWFQMPLNQNQNNVFTTFEILHALSAKKIVPTSFFSYSYTYFVSVDDETTKVVGSKYKSLDTIIKVYLNKPSDDEKNKVYGETDNNTYEIYDRDGSSKVYLNKASDDEKEDNNTYEYDNNIQKGGKTRSNLKRKRSNRKRSNRKRSNRKRSNLIRKRV